MSKLMIVPLACVLALVAVSCGEKAAEKPGLGEKAEAAVVQAEKAAGDVAGKYAEIAPVLGEQADLLQSTAAKLETAASAKEVADILNSLSGSQEKLMATMKSLSEKFPEMKSQAAPPAELQGAMAQLSQAGARFGQAMSAAMQKYGSDPLVQEAMKKFEEMSTRAQQ